MTTSFVPASSRDNLTRCDINADQHLSWARRDQ
jgi:hypothetical protein